MAAPKMSTTTINQPIGWPAAPPSPGTNGPNPRVRNGDAGLRAFRKEPVPGNENRSMGTLYALNQLKLILLGIAPKLRQFAWKTEGVGRV
jgi:hypothetical protein